MKALLMGLALLATAVAGCGHAEQQRQAQEYERFLKDALGTVMNDAPVQAHANPPANSAVD